MVTLGGGEGVCSFPLYWELMYLKQNGSSLYYSSYGFSYKVATKIFYYNKVHLKITICIIVSLLFSF